MVSQSGRSTARPTSHADEPASAAAVGWLWAVPAGARRECTAVVRIYLFIYWEEGVSLSF